MSSTTAPTSMFTRLRGVAAKLTKVRVRVTPSDFSNPFPSLSALNRVLRTGYATRRLDPSSHIVVEDTRFGRRVSCDGRSSSRITPSSSSTRRTPCRATPTAPRSCSTSSSHNSRRATLAANLGNFALFGQSTSTNRILPRGTRVAFWS